MYIDYLLVIIDDFYFLVHNCEEDFIEEISINDDSPSFYVSDLTEESRNTSSTETFTYPFSASTSFPIKFLWLERRGYSPFYVMTYLTGNALSTEKIDII